MNLTSLNEINYFDDDGNLTKNGRIQFWAEVNHTLKKFEGDNKLLLPTKPKQKSTKTSKTPPRNTHHRPFHYSHDRYHWYKDGSRKRSQKKLKLPTLPPKCKR